MHRGTSGIVGVSLAGPVNAQGAQWHGTLHGRGRLKSHGLSETPIVWRNTSDTFTPRGLGYNRSSCELVKRFELKRSDGELQKKKPRENGRNVTSFRGMASVASDMGWL